MGERSDRMKMCVSVLLLVVFIVDFFFFFGL